MQPTRKLAAARGELFFSNGKPCRQGHVGLRYVSTGSCVTCQKASSAVAKKNAFPELRPGIVCLKAVFVPRKHAATLLRLAAAFCREEGLPPGPPATAYRVVSQGVLGDPT